MIIFLWILIQIIGESLPISSSGHVQLMQNVLGMSVQSFAWMIDFLLHGPTIIILLVHFFSTWWRMIFGEKSKVLFKGLSLFDFWILDRGRGRREQNDTFISQHDIIMDQNDSFTRRPRENEDPGKQIKSYSFFFSSLLRPMFFIFIADLITFIFWALKIKENSFIQTYFLPIGFCLTALCLYFSRYAKSDKSVAWLWSDAIILGLVQAVSLLPGISRFASTYAAGVWLGYNRNTAFALSFLIQMPLLCAAFLKAMIALAGHHEILINFMQNWVILPIIVASLISYKLFCWVAMLIEQNKLWYFTGYMIIPIFMSVLMVKDVGV